MLGRCTLEPLQQALVKIMILLVLDASDNQDILTGLERPDTL